MPGVKRHKKPVKDSRPIVVDDFIYNDPDGLSGSAEPAAGSDTPDEAIRKLRGRPAEEPAPEPESAVPEETGTDAGKSAQPERKVYSSGVILDEDLQPVDVKGRRPRREHRFLRGFLLTLITLSLLLTIAAYVFHRISPSTPGLGEPESLISRIITPIQSVFSGVSESVAGYFRSMKLRANIEAEYNALRAENERLVYQAMLADELKYTLSQYEDLSEEIRANIGMNYIVCSVIGKSDSNYFATFTINKGLADGVEDYMAVTISGALVGYTENVQEHSATVRTIIDSNASIAALIQSSRDQGTIRGTLGIDGKPMCRMYYLPSENLPRSGDQVVTSGIGMSFPKGIPIGVVRSSTRGMEDNKQYIVVEPLADFQHLEYVNVLRYKPQAEAIQGRDGGGTSMELEPLESPRPSAMIPEIAESIRTPEPEEGEGEGGTPGEQETPEPTPEETPSPTPEPSDAPEPTPYETPLEYNPIGPRSDDPTPSPTPTWAPTPTPYLTPDPNEMTWEEDE